MGPSIWAVVQAVGWSHLDMSSQKQLWEGVAKLAFWLTRSTTLDRPFITGFHSAQKEKTYLYRDICNKSF